MCFGVCFGICFRICFMICFLFCCETCFCFWVVVCECCRTRVATVHPPSIVERDQCIHLQYESVRSNRCSMYTSANCNMTIIWECACMFVAARNVFMLMNVHACADRASESVRIFSPAQLAWNCVEIRTQLV